MAYQVSPGVNWTEIDLTTVVPAASTTEGAFAGEFVWGPVNEIHTISNEVDLVRWFGKPSSNTQASSQIQGWWTAANFLAYGDNLQVIRAVNATANNSTGGAAPIRILNKNDYELNFMNMQAGANSGMFAGKYPGELTNGVKVSVLASSIPADFNNWEYKSAFDGAPGTSAYASARAGSNDEMHIVVVDDIAGSISGTPNTVLERFSYVSKAIDAKNDDGSSNYYVNVLNERSSYVYAINHAQELAANVASLTLVSGGTGYTGNSNIIFSGGSGSGIVATANTGFSNNSPITSINLINRGTGYKLHESLSANVAMSSPGGNTYAVVTVALQSANTDQYSGTSTWGLSANSTAFAESNASYTTTLTNGSLGGTVTDANLQSAYNLLNAADSVDVSLIMTGAHSNTVCQYVIQNVAEVRKDCVVFVSPAFSDVVNNAGGEAAAAIARRNFLGSSSYAVMDSSWKYQFDKYYNVYRWVPLNGDTAGLCARTDQVRDPWYSPAGLNRGQIKNVYKLSWNPTKADRDTLYKSGINPVVTFKGDGTVLYGDKTLQSKPSAFDRINVRRLFIVLEKTISRAAKYSLFEFNDDFTRSQFVALVEPFLRDVKGRRGIYDYRVVCDDTNNTAEVIDRNEFIGDIYIKPSRSINFIQLNFVAVRTGVAFSEIVGKF